MIQPLMPYSTPRLSRCARSTPPSNAPTRHWRTHGLGGRVQARVLSEFAHREHRLEMHDRARRAVQAQCPARILSLLTPTDNAYALEWRARCQARIDRARARPAITLGAIVTLGGKRYTVTRTLGRRASRSAMTPALLTGSPTCAHASAATSCPRLAGRPIRHHGTRGIVRVTHAAARTARSVVASGSPH